MSGLRAHDGIIAHFAENHLGCSLGKRRQVDLLEQLRACEMHAVIGEHPAKRGKRVAA